MVRVIRRHHTALKFCSALVAGLALACLVWWLDWFVDLPTLLGHPAPLYETHVMTVYFVLPAVLLAMAYFEQRPRYLIAMSVLLNLGYWNLWQACRFVFENQRQKPLGAFLIDNGGVMRNWWLVYGVILAIAFARFARFWSPRLEQDGTLCPHCGYTLKWLPELRCPECGHTPQLEELAPPGGRAATLLRR